MKLDSNLSLNEPQAGDMCAITCYFNPQRYATKRPNFDKFYEGLCRAGVPLYVAELAMGDSPFELDERVTTLRLRCADVVWQKERLLNLLIAQLPRQWTKVAWVDCDLIFENEDWLKAASAALEESRVIQLFSEAVRLDRYQTTYRGTGELSESFCARCCQAPQYIRSGKHALHGHTGFAWATHREVLERVGLYDGSVSYSGDHLMAHAFVGDFNSKCVWNMVGASNPFSRHFTRWATEAFKAVGGAVGYTPGRILHLWHGEHKDRRYFLRNKELQAFAFNPEEDISLTEDGLWKWASHKPALHRWSREMFATRNEDGLPSESDSMPQ